MTEDEIRARFGRLCDYELNLAVSFNDKSKFQVFNLRNTVQPIKLLYRGKACVAKISPDAYEKYDNLSDYFNERARIRCKRHDQKISPYEYWEQNKDKLRGTVAERREQLYKEYYECTSFKPSLLVGFAKYLCGKNPPRILDISSGWGDRLIGAAAVAECYAGCDPNSDLFPGYEEIYNFFGLDRSKFSVVNSTFQDMQLPTWRPNLVLTSPPYYNLEEYGNVKVTCSLNEWMEEFLHFSLRKASNALEVGGHLVININDVAGGKDRRGDIHFVERMLNFNLPNMVFLGCIGQAQFVGNKPKSIQPFWIWKKVNLPIPAELNPKVAIVDHIHNGAPFRVIRDDSLLAGSKQRVMQEIFARHPEGIVYAGPENGYAQVALALGAKLCNSKVAILIPKRRPLTKQTMLASQLGAEIFEREGDRSWLKNMRIEAEKMARARRMHMPDLGFQGTEFNSAMGRALDTSLDLDRKGEYEFWIAGGSGTMALFLLEEFPNSKVKVVQVGKKIDWFFEGNPRAEVYKAGEKPSDLYVPAPDVPPYPSLSTYDAKVWQFAKTNLKPNTIIWNVAGEAEIF
jgi:hypothetical protein